jgi:ubiquinol-cytochrome c reductase cytochrome c subunit
MPAVMSRARPDLRVVAAVASLVLALAALPSAALASSPPTIVKPSDENTLSPQELGRQLFAGNCSTCHGSTGRGVSASSPQQGVTDIKGEGPSLIGVGKLATDFYLRTGYMPLSHVPDQPERNPVQFSNREIGALEDYVDSLSPTPGPPIPKPDPASGSVSQGLQLFTEHCAGCHQVVAEGGVVTGARVPPLNRATATQIAQAVRIGPYLMPKFDNKDITDAQLNSIIRYVLYTHHPQDEGGWGINHLGPFPEGMVTWGIAALLLIGICLIIGERVRRA